MADVKASTSGSSSEDEGPTETVTRSTAPRSRSVQQRINVWVNGTIERAFDALGRLLGRRPLLMLILPIIFALACASGISQLDNEERGEKLWQPDDTIAADHADFIEDIYPAFASVQNVFVRFRDERNVLVPEAFDEAYRLHVLTTNDVQWNNARDGNRKVSELPDAVSYKDICLNRNSNKGAQDVSNCQARNVLALFSYDPVNWESTDSILTRINDPTLWNTSTVGDGVVTEELLGGLTLDASGQIAAARTLSLTYFAFANQTLIDDEKDDPAVEGWEEEWLDTVEAQEDASASFQFPRIASRSFDDEFGDAVDGDIALLQAALIAIAVFTGVALSDFKQGFAGSRAALTAAGLLTIAMAVVSSYGLGSYFGLIFSPLMSVLPFIMLGVGVDGIFVLQFALDRTDPSAPIEDRMAETMRHAGVSVTIASLTNFFAFLIGSNTSLPALSAFSVYAALGVLFNLIYQITFFAAVMRYDILRQERNKLDVLCCVPSCEDPAPGVCCGAFGKGTPKQRPSVKAMSFIGRLMPSRAFRVVVVVLWVALLVAGIIGSSQMRVEADVNDFIPDGSYLNDYFDTVDDDFTTGTGNSGALYLNDAADEPLDFSSTEVQSQLDAAVPLLQANEWIIADTVDSWWSAFKAASGGTVSPETFWVDLETFLKSDEGRFYEGDIVFYADHAPPAVVSGIRSCRIGFEFRYIDDTSDLVDSMDSSRSIVDDVPAPLSTNAFVYGSEFQQIEQYKSIGREALMNLGLGVLMIALVIVFLLANLVASVITFLCVVSAIVELVGIMRFLGFHIDSVTVIFLVIAMGLAVDYSVHVAHGFLATREDDIWKRVRITMEETGASVVNGATSTLIAALCLSGSGSYVFVTFFFALLFVVIFGAFSGLFVLPVLLTTFKPAAHAVVVQDTSPVPETSVEPDGRKSDV